MSPTIKDYNSAFNGIPFLSNTYRGNSPFRCIFCLHAPFQIYLKETDDIWTFPSALCGMTGVQLLPFAIYVPHVIYINKYINIYMNKYIYTYK